MEPQLEALIAQGTVKLEYKHMTVVNQVRSQWAAEASECAADQGKFWVYHDTLLTNQAAGFTKEILKKYARDLGMNEKEFAGCLDGGTHTQKVKNQTAEAIQLGLPGTPSFLVNGKTVNWQTFDDVVKAVKEAAK